MTTETIAPPRAEEFSVGDPVRYVPDHAKGNLMHPDCENGRVTSVNPDTQTVFVRFNGSTSAGCKPHQLV